jgi:hypothetical protein
VQSNAKTVAEYLKSLPPDRRAAIQAVRQVILKNLPKGFEEMMQYGMIGYVVPHSLYPAGYHCNPKLPLPFAALSSQKHHMGFGLCYIFDDPKTHKWFVDSWKAAGKRLDMGKVCVRFRRLEDVPLDVIGRLMARTSVKEFISLYENSRKKPRRKKR